MEHVIVIFEGQRRLIAKPPSYEVLVQLARAYFAILPTAGLSLSYFPLIGGGSEGIDLKPNKYDEVADCTYILISLLSQPTALSYAAAAGSVKDGQGKAESFGWGGAEGSVKSGCPSLCECPWCIPAPGYTASVYPSLAPRSWTRECAAFAQPPPEGLKTTVPARKANWYSPSGSFAGGSIRGFARNSEQGNGWGRNHGPDSPQSGTYGRDPLPRCLPRSAWHSVPNSLPPSPHGWGRNYSPDPSQSGSYGRGPTPHSARDAMPPSPRGWGAGPVAVDDGWGTGSVFHSGNKQWTTGRIRDSIEPQDDSVHLTIRDPHASLDDQRLTFKVRPGTKISKLHAAIAARPGYMMPEFYLLHERYVLEDRLTIADYKIKNGDTVDLKFYDWAGHGWATVGKRGKTARTEDF